MRTLRVDLPRPLAAGAMKELSDILGLAELLHDSGEPFALATVVKVLGSAYRRPGARMLILKDGTSSGSISGGCLEAEVVQQALAAIESDTSTVHVFRLGEDDHISGFGLGCGGDVHVLIEPEPFPGRTPATDLIRTGWLSRSETILATVIGPETAGNDWIGRRAALLHDGRILGELAAWTKFDEIRANAGDLLHAPKPHIHLFEAEDRTLEVLFEVLPPPVQLVLFGDGPDVTPLVRMGHELGWRVVVVGRKPVPDLRRQFPDASEHVFLMHPENVLNVIALDAWSAAIVMTHNVVRDRDLLAQILPSAVRYVGALGPKHRTSRILEELDARGASFEPGQLERLHAPVGLDIGTESPEQIALSVLAEIQAVFSARPGRPLKDREGPIHDPMATA